MRGPKGVVLALGALRKAGQSTALAQRSGRVMLGPNASALGPEMRHDGCHFNTAGRDALVVETLVIMAPSLRRLGPAAVRR